MKLAYICSRYADPDINNRRRNLAEARALARWAEAHGYAVVTWWGSIDPDDPPCDSDEAARAQALARSGILAGVVGFCGGVVVMAGWYRQTSGMAADVAAYDRSLEPIRRRPADVRLVSWSEVEPYYRAPVDHVVDANKMIPRAAVQAVADEMAAGIERTENNICNGASAELGTMAISAYRDALDELRDKCGVTPTEVQS